MKNSLAQKPTPANRNLSTNTALCIFAAFLFAAFVAFTAPIQANAQMTGEWTAYVDSQKTEKFVLMFTRRPNPTSINQTSRSFNINDFQNLSSQMITAGSPNVNFKLTRQAGTFDFDGLFKNGKGVGFWTFTPNQTFVAALKSRGYDNLSDESVLSAAMNDLTPKFIEDLRSAGFANLEFSKVLRASSRNISPEFIRELRSAGFDNLTIDEIVRAKDRHINADFMKKVRAMGFERQPLESLIRLRTYEITPEFVNEMRSAGFENLTVEEVIRLKRYEITPEYVRDLKAEGYANLGAETVIRSKRRGIDRAFIQRVKGQGLTDVTLEQLIKLRSQINVK